MELLPPPPLPDTLEAALQQCVPRQASLSWMTKVPGAGHALVLSKPTPAMAPLPPCHTLAVRNPQVCPLPP